MPVKAGSSHAGAAFTALVLGYAFRTYLDAHSSELRGLTDSVGLAIVNQLALMTGIRLPRVMAGMVTITITIAFLWGACYHITRHSRSSD